MNTKYIKKTLTGNDGQTLIEFILLIAVLMVLSFSLLKGMNGYLATRWVSIIKIIARPTTTNIEL